MSDLLAIFGAPEADAELVSEIARLHPSRVTVLMQDVDPDWAVDESPEGTRVRRRLAELLTAIEGRTGASVAGTAGDRDQLLGWRFDREVMGRSPVPA
jgi:hypothetical protein